MGFSARGNLQIHYTTNISPEYVDVSKNSRIRCVYFIGKKKKQHQDTKNNTQETRSNKLKGKGEKKSMHSEEKCLSSNHGKRNIYFEFSEKQRSQPTVWELLWPHKGQGNASRLWRRLLVLAHLNAATTAKVQSMWDQVRTELLKGNEKVNTTSATFLIGYENRGIKIPQN